MGKGWPLIFVTLIIFHPIGWAKTPIDNWTFKIRLFSPHFKDQENYIGVWSGCARGIDPEDAAEPPALPGRPNVACLPPDGGYPLALDLRPPVLQEESWQIRVSALESGATHTLIFDYVDDVPEEYLVECEDLVTGETLDLRSIHEYVFVPSESESDRNFLVTVTKPLPEPPGFVQAIRSGRTLTVSWSPSTSPFVTGYVIYLGTDSGEVVNRWYVGHDQIELVAEELQLNRYYVAVSAVDNAFREGELSEWCAVVPRILTRFDMTRDGRMERNDVFLLAGNWMKPVAAKTQEGEDIMVSINVQFLNEFMGTWLDLRFPGMDLSPDTEPPVTDADVEYLVEFLELANNTYN